MRSSVPRAVPRLALFRTSRSSAPRAVPRLAQFRVTRSSAPCAVPRHAQFRATRRCAAPAGSEWPAGIDPPPLPSSTSDVAFPLQQLELDRVLTLIAMEAKSSLGKGVILGRRPLASRKACDAAQGDLADMLRFFHREGLLPLAGLVDVAPMLAGETV